MTAATLEQNSSTSRHHDTAQSFFNISTITNSTELRHQLTSTYLEEVRCLHLSKTSLEESPWFQTAKRTGNSNIRPEMCVWGLQLASARVNQQGCQIQAAAQARLFPPPSNPKATWPACCVVHCVADLTVVLFNVLRNATQAPVAAGVEVHSAT